MRLKSYKILILLLFFSLGCVEAEAQGKSAIVFRNVKLIDMQSEQPKPNMTVVVSGNRISEIGENVKIPKNAKVVDASGRFLIPGLWECMFTRFTRHISLCLLQAE